MLFLVTAVGANAAVFGRTAGPYIFLALMLLWSLVLLAIAIEYPHFPAWLFSRDPKSFHEQPFAAPLVRTVFGIAGAVIAGIAIAILLAGRLDLTGF